MNNNNWLLLQLFADGDGGEGAAAGEAPAGASVDAGHKRLLELGVPADKIRARKKSAALPNGTVRTEPAQAQQTKQQVAAAQDPTEEPKKDEPDTQVQPGQPKRMTWDEIMADPEYNKQMQATMRARLKSANAAEENLKKMAPALEVLARKHNMDPDNIDYEALSKAINNDDSFYSAKALEMGVSVEAAKKADQDERDTLRQKRQEVQTIQQQKLQNRYNQITQQSEEMKKIFPNFNLQKEMENPAFARLMAPDMPFTVEQAYHAVHHKEIQAAAMEVAARKAAEKISKSIQAGTYRPSETGTSGQVPSVTTFSYRNASREQREALKRQIREAGARGEKVYPGGR